MRRLVHISTSSRVASAIVPTVVVFAVLIFTFWPILTSLYESWFNEVDNMEHGILVIPAAAYIAWTKRDQLQQIPRKPSALGLVLLLWGAIQAIVATAAHWAWVSRTAFLVSLIGCIAALHGLRMVRALAYPLLVLVLMIAPPTIIYERLTLSLQLLASRLGETCLEALGYSVLREGNILEMVGTKLSIEEACSGIRSLLSIIFMCVIYDYFFVRGRLMKAMILILAVPIAILGNGGRIIATGIVSQYSPELARGAPHEALGYASVLIAGIGCVAAHGVMLAMKRMWRSQHV